MLQIIFGTINVSGNAYISIHRVELHKARLFRSRLTEPFHLHARQFRRRAQFCTRREVFVQILHKRVPPTVVQPQMGMQNMGIGPGPASKLLLQLPATHQTDPQSQLANRLPAPTEPMCPRMHYTGGVTCMCVCCADIFRLLTACLYYDLVVSLCGAQN